MVFNTGFWSCRFPLAILALSVLAVAAPPRKPEAGPESFSRITLLVNPLLLIVKTLEVQGEYMFSPALAAGASAKYGFPPHENGGGDGRAVGATVQGRWYPKVDVYPRPLHAGMGLSWTRESEMVGGSAGGEFDREEISVQPFVGGKIQVPDMNGLAFGFQLMLSVPAYNTLGGESAGAWNAVELRANLGVGWSF